MGLIKITSDMSETERLAAYNSNMQYLKSEDESKIDSSSVADFIIEQGVSGIWTYRKWHSGVYEAWHQDENTAAYSFPNKYGATVGNDRIMYTTDNIDHDLPTFSNSLTFYTGTASAISLFSWGLIWIEDVNGSPKMRVRIATNTNPGSNTSSCRINLYIKGTWK